MKIKFQPTINIESDDIDYAVDALMLEHGMQKAGANAYLSKLMTDEARVSVRNLISELKQIKHN
jgi:hypothetical protein